MRIIHTLLFMIRKDFFEEDLIMAGKCFETLSFSEENTVVIYNQGFLSNDELEGFLAPYNINYHILGDGFNIGIPQARQTCFEYIWDVYPDVPYISEIHLDMIFPANWYTELITYLEENDEPLISPAIITKSGEIAPSGNGNFSLPEQLDDLLILLKDVCKDEVVKGFVHPVIHRTSALKSIGGYDVVFLSGKQAYEDDSLLLGYYYFIGTRNNWYPKVCFKSVVYHAYLGQRLTLEDLKEEQRKNLEGLLSQYGARGFKHLTELHILDSKDHFQQLYDLTCKKNN